MRKRLAIGALALLWGAGTAVAAPIDLPGDTPLFIHFNDIEQVNFANNLLVPGYAPAAAHGTGLSGNWALFNVDDIRTGFAIPVPAHDDIAGGGPLVFSNDGALGSNGQVTAIFYGFQFDTFTAGHDGVIDLYWHDAGSDTVDASCLAGVGCAPDAAAVSRFTTGNGGVFLARLDLEFGIIPGNGVTTLVSSADPTTEGGSGQSDSFASVDLSAGGAWASALNGNWFFVDGPDAGTTRGDSPNELRDVRLSTFFNTTLEGWDGPVGSGTQGVRSNDPARVLSSAVPEPATLTLLGLGLAGVAARRRKKAKA